MRLLTICILQGIGWVATAQFVTTKAQLYAAADSAGPGTSIVIQNGSYADVDLRIEVNGTVEDPVIVRAQSKGGVTFSGSSTVQMGGRYIYLQGINFVGNPGADTSSVIQLKRSTECQHCKVFNVTFDAYNQTEILNKKVWVHLYGQHNEVAHCSFLNKIGKGSCVLVNRSMDTPNYHLIHHNYFAGRRPVFEPNSKLANDQDAIRIGVSTTAQSSSYTAVFNNYFYDWEGEVEIISSKSGHNRFYNNTFENYFGLLTLRHGDHCEVYNNFFLARQHEKSGGVRLIDSGHQVYNNYIEGTRFNSSDFVGAISIINGQQNAADNGYQAVESALIVNNTIVDADKGIRIGLRTDFPVAPRDLTIANNMFLDVDCALEVVTEPNGTNLIAHNLYENSDWCNQQYLSTNQEASPLLPAFAEGYYRTANGSPAVNTAVGNYPTLSVDITNGFRTPPYDRGAEEYLAVGDHRPYTPSDVGSRIGAASGGIFHCYHRDRILDLPLITNRPYQTRGQLLVRGQLLEASAIRLQGGAGVTLLPDFSVPLGAELTVVATACTNDRPAGLATAPTPIATPSAARFRGALFPNPATDRISFLSAPDFPTQTWYLHDVAGRRVRTYPSVDSGTAHTFDLRDLPPGWYYLRGHRSGVFGFVKH